MNFQEILQNLGLTEMEYFNIRERIKNLRVDQICALADLVGVKFNREELEKIAKLIKETDSVNLDTIITEAKSIKDLLFWVEIFEKYK